MRPAASRPSKARTDAQGPASVESVADITCTCVVRVHGLVQGVGFRWWARSQLARHGLAGRATNLTDGSVEVLVRGDPAAVAGFVAALRGPHVPGRVDSVEVDPSASWT